MGLVTSKKSKGNAQKEAKNAFVVFLGCFWAYVGQPHNHIGWATLKPFASINAVWELAVLKISFLLNHPFWNYFQKKRFLLHSHENQSNHWLARIGKILIKPNITTLFDPCQTFWCRASVWKCKLLSKKSNPPTVPICSIGPYKPTQLNANQKRRRSFAKAKSFFQSNCLTRDVTRAPHIRQKRWSCSTRLKVR